MSGGTVTITNVGVFGVDTGTPILNPGESAILAFGAIKLQPWVHKGKVKPRQVTTLALSFDHRLVDGELGSKVLADVGGGPGAAEAADHLGLTAPARPPARLRTHRGPRRVRARVDRAVGRAESEGMGGVLRPRRAPVRAAVPRVSRCGPRWRPVAAGATLWRGRRPDPGAAL